MRSIPPNILMVVFDTARADAFEPWGAPAGSTPTVAQLSRSGEALEHAYATGCWTVPSHGSMFSGRLPRADGLTQGSHQSFAQSLAARRDKLLPSVLGSAGYETAAVSANAWVSPDSGFDQGFEQFVDLLSHRFHGILDRSLRGRIKWYLQALRSRVDDGAVAIERLVV